MFNPFVILSEKLLVAFVNSGKRYFVRQTFRRGHNPSDHGIRECFLITHYSDFAHAQAHFTALVNDGNRFLYDWEQQEHRVRLVIASRAPAGFRVYAGVFASNWERLITKELKQKVKDYADSIGWKVRGADGVEFTMDVQFGELYLRVKGGAKEARVKLTEVERLLVSR